MAPLHSAIAVEHVVDSSSDPALSVYRGEVDADWTVYVVPNGGYVLGLVIDAAIQHQRQHQRQSATAAAAHPDPIHVTAHFLRSASLGPFEVHVRGLKRGRGYTHLIAHFVQNDVVKVMTHLIFGVLAPYHAPPPPPASSESSDAPARPTLTIAPPSPYAARIPMYTHPSSCTPTSPTRVWNYAKHVRIADDPVYAARHSAGAGEGGKANESGKTSEGGKEKKENGKTSEGMEKGLEWGMWLTLTDPAERITPASVAFFADTFKALDELVGGAHLQNRLKSWAPTMVLTLEFKFPIPPRTSPHHAPRTVAVYSSGKFMNDPSARHDTYVEVWTAPSDADAENGRWREDQRCLAVATQMAILVPREVNLKRGRSAKL